MYKLLFILCLCFAMRTQAATQPAPTAKYLKDTVIRGQTLKLYLGARGGRFVVRKSKTTGKLYNDYSIKQR